MHVAVCDDNIADRKQTERLLGRESDRRAKITEGLFVDSYGNEQALLTKPMQYDIFYIDMCQTSEDHGKQIALQLIKAGIQVPIYMCCSKIDYRNQDFPENVFFLDKPLRVEDLITSLDHAEQVKSLAVSRIELRDDKETFYVTEDMILYAVEKGNRMLVTLTDGRTVKLVTNINNLYDQWKSFHVFLAPNAKTLVNARYVTKIGLLQMQMTDGHNFLLQGVSRRAFQDIWEQYRNEL